MSINLAKEIPRKFKNPLFENEFLQTLNFIK